MTNKTQKLQLSKIIVDVGCGYDKKAQAIGIDNRKTKATDILGDAQCLPFKDSTIDELYSSHCIEHFSHRKVKNVIEWIRVVKPGD